jgi:predicted DNA-binding transcriptional regulator AlpA
MLGLSINTLYRRISSGDIRAEGPRPFRIRLSEVRTPSSDRGFRALLRSRP